MLLGTGLMRSCTGLMPVLVILKCMTQQHVNVECSSIEQMVFKIHEALLWTQQLGMSNLAMKILLPGCSNLLMVGYFHYSQLDLTSLDGEIKTRTERALSLANWNAWSHAFFVHLAPWDLIPMHISCYGMLCKALEVPQISWCMPHMHKHLLAWVQTLALYLHFNAVALMVCFHLTDGSIGVILQVKQ